MTLCKVSAHMEIKGNEEATDMLGMATTKLPHTDYYLTIRSARNSEQQRKQENNTSKLHYITPRIEVWESAHSSCRHYWTHQTNPWTFDDKKQPTIRMWKFSMWKPVTDN